MMTKAATSGPARIFDGHLYWWPDASTCAGLGGEFVAIREGGVLYMRPMPATPDRYGRGTGFVVCEDEKCLLDCGGLHFHMSRADVLKLAFSGVDGRCLRVVMHSLVHVGVVAS